MLRLVANAGLRSAPDWKSGSLRFPKETPVKLCIQCYAGHRGEEEPRAFDLGDRRIEVMKIIDRWRSPIIGTLGCKPTMAACISCATMRPRASGS